MYRSPANTYLEGLLSTFYENYTSYQHQTLHLKHAFSFNPSYGSNPTPYNLNNSDSIKKF